MAVVMGIALVLARNSSPMDFGRGWERNALGLNGTWKVLLEHGEEPVWEPATSEALGPWQDVTVPGSLLPGIDRKAAEGVHTVWARKRFTLNADRRGQGVLLRWNGIRFGAVIFLNGRKLAEHTAIGPGVLLLPADVLTEGENELLLKVPGWAGVLRSASGYPLIPTGASTQRWGTKQASIFYDIWLEFYNDICMKWVLAMPDVAAESVTFRVWLDGERDLTGPFDLSAEVRPAGEKSLVGSGRISVDAGDQPVDLPVVLLDVRPWTLEEPNLYEVRMVLTRDGNPCDEVRFRFGMRELRVVDGHYRLNGRPFWFRGSNLVNEWHWSGNFNAEVKRYLVDEARAMNLNAFRTHTLPPPHLWLDVSDEHGVGILAEFPVLYNCANFRFTPEEYEVWHRNALVDATGWVTTLWNHPSVLMWVLSNESFFDDAWESGPFYEHVKNLDPTRVCMRSWPKGSNTREVVDFHTCGNYARGPEGATILTVQKEAARKDPTRTLGNSEYMNYGGGGLQWLGEQKHPDQPLVFAEFALEHTEAMRRERLDLILPYMYAGWTGMRGANWRPGFPTPMAAALHSSMAPVLASLDLFDRNFRVGAEVVTPLALINELHREVEARVDVYLTPRDPLFIPDQDAVGAAVWRDGFDVVLPADSLGWRDLSWRVPSQEGNYFLAVVLTRDGDGPVASQRVVRAIGQDSSRSRLAGRRVLVLGADEFARSLLAGWGLQLVELASLDGPGPDVTVVWDASAITPKERASAAALRKYVEGGGRLVILDQASWEWNELLEFCLEELDWSRAFAYPEVKHRMLTDVAREYLKRWNGLPGTVADRVIRGNILEQGSRLGHSGPGYDGRTKLLWVKEPANTVALVLTMGEGEAVVSMLKLRARLQTGKKGYDPIAERVLANLLAP